MHSRTELSAKWAALAIGLPALLLTAQLIWVLRSPEDFSQTTDAVFHLNAVKYMVVSGDASVFAPATGLNGSPSFYPAAWHTAVSLVVVTTGVSVQAATAAVNIVIGAAVWPIGVVFFSRQIMGNAPRFLIPAGVLSAAFGVFPYRMLDWGVLYPSYLALSVALPVAGLFLVLIGRARSGDSVPLVPGSVLFAAGLLGLALAQPNTILIVGIIVCPALASIALFGARLKIGRGGQIAAAGGVALVVLLWVFLRPIPLTEIKFTLPYQTTAQAIGEILWASPLGALPAFALGPLIAVGLVHLVRQREDRWYVAAHGLVILLFVAASASQQSGIRTFLTGSWYDDFNRIASTTVLTSIPLAAIGFSAVHSWFQRVAMHSGARVVRRLATGRWSLVPMALGLIVVLAVSQYTSVNQATKSARRNYEMTPTSPMVSTSEYQMMEELPRLIPPDEAMVGNPWNGSALAYLVSGTKTIFSHMFVPMTPDRDTIARHLNEVVGNPAVCNAVRNLNVHFVFWSYQDVFPFGYPQDGQYDGLKYIPVSAGFKLVKEIGVARLYKITACWGED